MWLIFVNIYEATGKSRVPAWTPWPDISLHTWALTAV